MVLAEAVLPGPLTGLADSRNCGSQVELQLFYHNIINPRSGLDSIKLRARFGNGRNRYERTVYTIPNPSKDMPWLWEERMKIHLAELAGEIQEWKKLPGVWKEF